MRIEPHQVKALVALLRDWGYQVSAEDEADLVAEYDVAEQNGETRPDDNRLGGFHKGGSDTARQAALDNYPRSGTQREKVLLAVARAGDRGATSDEISKEYGIRLYSVKPRMLELRRGGWIEMTGATRPSDTGSQVDVHRVTAKGRDWIRQARAQVP